MVDTYLQNLKNLCVVDVVVYVPSVEFRALWNLFLHSLSMKLDLPTAASPAKTSLYMRSGTFPSTTDACNTNKQTLFTIS